MICLKELAINGRMGKCLINYAITRNDVKYIKYEPSYVRME